MSSAYVAWRAPSLRTWYPIGRLSLNDGLFEFIYTEGARRAKEEANFEPLASFPHLNARYISPELFPLFANRLLPKSRREYPQFIEWMSAGADDGDPVALLARSGGRRATDALELFQAPEPDPSGILRMHFFVHGIQHFSAISIDRTLRLEPGEQLLLMHDFQNPHDPFALMLRTSEGSPGDIYPIGYCPRYLLEDMFELLRTAPQAARVTVRRVNPPPAPIWFRLLCTLTTDWPSHYQPLSGSDYQPFPGAERQVVISPIDPKHNTYYSPGELRPNRWK
jgi:hypothetical protein